MINNWRRSQTSSQYRQRPTLPAPVESVGLVGYKWVDPTLRGFFINHDFSQTVDRADSCSSSSGTIACSNSYGPSPLNIVKAKCHSWYHSAALQFFPGLDR